MKRPIGRIQSFRLRDVQPSPFRNQRKFPLDKERVAQLEESVRATGFWSNVLVRVIEGKPVLIYGHHRVQAAKNALGEDAAVPFVVVDCDDAMAARVLGYENMEDRRSPVMGDCAVVWGVIHAYADGRLELPAPAAAQTRKGLPDPTRYAPSFIPARSGAPRDDNAKPWTLTTLAEVLAWKDASGRPNRRLATACGVLEMVERGILDLDDVRGLSVEQARAALAEARDTLKYHEDEGDEPAKERARSVAKHVTAKLREPSVTISAARMAAADVELRHAKEERKPDVDRFAERMANKYAAVLGPMDEDRERLKDVVKFREYLSGQPRRRLVSALRGMSQRAADFADRIEADSESDATKERARLPEARA